MSPLLRFLIRSLPPHSHLHRRTFVDAAAFKCVRDRGLDHAVEREKNLLPLINTKNLIKLEPSKSLPISIIADNRASLKIPTRPIEFIRRYPSVFREFFPAGAAFQPHIKLTDEALDLDSEEQIMFQSESYKKDVADRVLKLLMLCRGNKLPLNVIENLKWDLGLPPDYERSLIPEFPDYFRIVGREETRVLELVCWIDELGTSIMEKKAMGGVSDYAKGMPIAFPMHFSKGFEMDKKLKKWVSYWQKLPYVSPYENADYLSPKSDESDKWAVAVLHELLHILVPKKTEKENVLCLGEHLGIRSRFKRASLNHPGIFYLSSKIGTYTLVLKEGYKRGLLIENHPLTSMRSKYIHLMNTVKEDSKLISVPGGSGNAKKQKNIDSESKGEMDGKEEDNEGVLYDSSDAEEAEDGALRGVAKNTTAANSRLRTRKKDAKGRVGNRERGRRSAGERSGKAGERVSPMVSTSMEMQGRGSRARLNLSKSRGREAPAKLPS
ncbi:hypothetical protein L484_016431 [Morus notabilis]|uniref:PORR domain-containing protein n=1 Tax=Morus notabilis TaxID=981085 RepID=W9RJV9_9ROSA|nr:protein ROOT PRIMORDIUM DEFECTIVE 1 [Morus notabilis]EXB57378.1 hypothetical protein L484_016431 [Morus notabilis]